MVALDALLPLPDVAPLTADEDGMADDEGADEPSRLSICAAVPIGTCCEMSGKNPANCSTAGVRQASAAVPEGEGPPCSTGSAKGPVHHGLAPVVLPGQLPALALAQKEVLP